MKNLLFSVWPAVLVLSGCAGTPNLVNRTIFNVQTNWVDQVRQVTQTNLVAETNWITMVDQQHQTNFVERITEKTNYTTATVTNEVPVYTYTDKPTALAAIQTGGGLAGAPWGIGGLLTTLLIGGYHIYQRTQNKQVAGALIQGIETAKEVLRTTPQGAQLAASFGAWLVNHQAAAGVITPISGLVDDLVNTSQAQGDAKNIITAKV